VSPLFSDQEEALQRVFGAFDAGFRAPVLVASTGWGKTHACCELIRRWVERGYRVWFLAHLEELLEDTSRRMDERQMPHSWIWGRKGHEPSCPIQLVSLGTARRRLDQLPRPDLVIIDECDLAVAQSYQNVLDAIGRPLVLGLTATPCRADGRPLREAGFDLLIPTADTIDLVEAGRLARVRLFSFPAHPDLDRVRTKGRDFDQEEVGAIMSRPVVLGDSLEHWERLCVEPDGRIRPTGAFCSGTNAAHELAKRWREAGYRAMAVDGNSSPDDRGEALWGLRRGRLDLVATADMWLAGIDIPEMAAVLCERKTASLRVWLQMCGRGMRRGGQWGDCIGLDHTGNAQRPGLGHPLARRMHLWDLDAGRQRRNLEKVPPVPVCQKCFSSDVVRGVCQECGHVREIRTPLGAVLVPGELVELDPRAAAKRQVEAERKAREAEERACKTLEELIALGHRRGYAHPEGWARMKMQLRQRWRTRAPRARVVSG
jgi:superfamily II DNA or RNA helicase